MELTAGDYRVVVAPQRGGSLLAFDWRGKPVMRACHGASIFDVACFPLVPFSNRIAHGRFAFGTHKVRLNPNFPGSDHPHPLHGFGWLSEWRVTRQDPSSVTMEHRHPVGAWPWPYRAEQQVTLSDKDLTLSLSVTNEASSQMPAGLGFHPYFPRDRDTRYLGLHRGEWTNDATCLPVTLNEADGPNDWWQGHPVGARIVDTAYCGRSGDLTVTWPSRDVALTITPSDNLDFTVVYTPSDADYFCIEPVTHMTDAVNSNRSDSGLVTLAPQQVLEATVKFSAMSYKEREA